MTSTIAPPGPAVHGATVFDTPLDLPRYRLGNALHAIRVYAVAVVEVALLPHESKRF